MDNKEIALLVEKAKENDKSAMGKLYNETHKKAYFVALKMTKNEDDAMDILQDSFVKAFKKIDTLENPEQFQSWLNQIVANKCRDYLKKKKEIFFSETEDEDGNSIEDTFEEENISLIPDKSLDTAETKRLVMNIIEGLSEDQKLCVLMYYYENMSVGDIAEALECSTGTVKSRLNYARQKIKTEVENLEKTQGIKLYGIAPIPFIVWVLMRMSESTVVPRDIAPLVIESAVGTAGAAGAATAAGGTAGAAAGGAAGATAGTVAGTAGASAVASKIVSGLLIGSVVLTAGMGALTIVGGIGVAGVTGVSEFIEFYNEKQEEAEWERYEEELRHQQEIFEKYPFLNEPGASDIVYENGRVVVYYENGSYSYIEHDKQNRGILEYCYSSNDEHVFTRIYDETCDYRLDGKDDYSQWVEFFAENNWRGML